MMFGSLEPLDDGPNAAIRGDSGRRWTVQMVDESAIGRRYEGLSFSRENGSKSSGQALDTKIMTMKRG